MKVLVDTLFNGKSVDDVKIYLNPERDMLDIQVGKNLFTVSKHNAKNCLACTSSTLESHAIGYETTYSNRFGFVVADVKDIIHIDVNNLKEDDLKLYEYSANNFWRMLQCNEVFYKGAFLGRAVAV